MNFKLMFSYFLFSAQFLNSFTHVPIFPPPIRDFDSLNEEDHAANLQLALDVGEREFGIRPFTSEKEMSGDQEPDKTTMITYLSKFYELFRGTPLPASGIPHRFNSAPFSLTLSVGGMTHRGFRKHLICCRSGFTSPRMIRFTPG